MKFFIGWHQPVNGRSGCHLFDRTMISVNRLLKRRSHFQVKDWILDSGAFTRISTGAGHLPIPIYAIEAKRWKDCGNLLAVVTQDYMCEEFILSKTGFDIPTHQRLTVYRYKALLKLLKGEPYLMPVLQGYSPQDYCNHIDMYGDLLVPGMWVGVGSVCKRNGSPAQIEAVLLAIKEKRPDLLLHGFGIKMTSLRSGIVQDLLYSADSQAHGIRTHKARRKGDTDMSQNDPICAVQYADKLDQHPKQMSIFGMLYA